MRNFDDTALDSRQQVATVAPQVREAIKVRYRGSHQTHLVRPEWSWEDLRDYVLTEMRIRGWRSNVYVQDPLKEAGIFKAFLRRWGSDRAQRIATFVFEVRDGIWLGEPVTPNRFTVRSDPFFAEPIADMLSER